MNRRDLLTSSGFLAVAGMMSAAGPKLPNSVVGKDAAKVTHEPFGDLRVYYEGPTDQLKSVTAGSLSLKPGMEPHPPHQHPEEEFMVITEGTGEIVVEGKTTKVGPGSMMYCGAGKLHGIRNTGKTPLLFYYYKWIA
jgi:mannose-6-phosphate isomerase-like protein (cupin superfamily)